MMSLPLQHLGRLLALVLFLAALVGGSRDARADTAAAQALFDAAKQLMAQGKYADACPKLEESQRLDPGIGTQFNLAACYEQLGRTASAWSMFLEVAGASKAAGQLEREKVARQRALALEPKLIRLTITAPADAPADLQVKRDGVAVGRAQWGTPVPVDPGKHTIEATAAGRRPFVKTLDLTTPGTSESVAIPPMAPAATPASPATPQPGSPYGAPYSAPPPGAVLVPRAGTVPPPPPNRPLTRRRSPAMMVTGIVLISVGALAGLTGGLIVAVCSADSGACDSSPPSTGFDEYDYLTTEEDDDIEGTGTGLLVGGLIGVGVGIPLTIIGARKVPVEPEPKKASLVPELLVGPQSAALRWSM